MHQLSVKSWTNCTRTTSVFVKPGTHWRQVEFNMVDVLESRQSRSCCFGPVHTGNKVDRIGNKVECIGNKVDRYKLSNTRCCRFVAKTGNKVERIGNKVERIQQQSTLLPVSATVDFQ